MRFTTRAVMFVAALCLACTVRAETNELRNAQQYGFSYLQLMVCSATA
jgi:hypothetical protein